MAFKPQGKVFFSITWSREQGELQAEPSILLVLLLCTTLLCPVLSLLWWPWEFEEPHPEATTSRGQDSVCLSLRREETFLGCLWQTSPHVSLARTGSHSPKSSWTRTWDCQDLLRLRRVRTGPGIMHGHGGVTWFRTGVPWRGKKKEVNVRMNVSWGPVALDKFSWHPLRLFQGVGLHTGWCGWAGWGRQLFVLKQNSEAPLGVTESPLESLVAGQNWGTQAMGYTKHPKQEKGLRNLPSRALLVAKIDACPHCLP